MSQTYVGIVRVDEKNWGKEHTLSLSEKDIQTLQGLLYKGWVKISIKKRKNPEGDKIGYGSVWTPDNARSGSQGNSQASQAPLVADEDIPQEPDLTESYEQVGDDNLPF